DLVGERAGVVAAAPCQGYALIETEEGLPAGWFLLDDDFDVRHLGPQLRRQPVEGVSGVLLEPFLAVEQLAFQLAQRPSLVRRRMPSLRCSARSSSPSFRAPQTNITPTTTRGRARTSTRTISAASFIRTRVVSGPYPSPSSGGSRRGIGEALIREVVVSP